MSRTVQDKCDFCGVIKQQTNHWYRIGIFKGELCIFPSDVDCSDPEVNPLLDACGEKCVLVGVQKFLEKRTLTD